MLDLDTAPSEFERFDKDLKKRGLKHLTSRDDKQRLRALAEGWFRELRPQFVAALGVSDAIEQIDREVDWLRARCSGKSDAAAVRTRLRSVARTIEREVLPAYDGVRWTQSALDGNAPSQETSPLASRLSVVSSAVELSYQQAIRDLEDRDRLTYVGPATELREVLGATIRTLSPEDDAIRSEPWFKGHEGRPTQAERIRAILADKERAQPAVKALEIVNEAIGAVGRLTYSRASAATHLGRESPRDEVERIKNWVDAVLEEILPREEQGAE